MGGAEGTKLDMEFTDMERVIINLLFFSFCYFFSYDKKTKLTLSPNPKKKTQKETKQTKTSVRLIIYFSENRRNSGVG